MTGSLNLSKVFMLQLGKWFIMDFISFQHLHERNCKKKGVDVMQTHISDVEFQIFF